jgi:hypothetical protein
MSKIKLLYDAVMAIKDKDSCSGNLKVEGSRNGVKIFGLNNDFEKNMGEGRTKAKISLEIDCEGKKVKHESSTEFDCPDGQDARRHDFLRRMMFHHGRGYHPNHGQMDGCHVSRCGGFKAKLNRLAFMLSVLNNLKIDERDDKSTVLALDFNEIPGELKKNIHEKLLQHKMGHEHGRECMFKEFSGMEVSNGGVNIFINKNKEVEKIILTVTGSQQDELNQPRHLDLQAELRLDW